MFGRNIFGIPMLTTTVLIIFTVLTFTPFAAVTMSSNVEAAEMKTMHVSQANAHGYP